MNIEPPEQWLCQLPSVDFDWVDDRNGHRADCQGSSLNVSLQSQTAR